MQALALQSAIERLEALAARQPGSVQAWALLGSAHVARGDGARKALAVAAGSPAAFTGQDEARKTLAELR
jgi:cytochrome c-type biogenesis protein CcmH/NrfG